MEEILRRRGRPFVGHRVMSADTLRNRCKQGATLSLVATTMVTWRLFRKGQEASVLDFAFMQAIAVTNRSRDFRQMASVPVPPTRTIWWTKVRGRLRGEGAIALQVLTFTMLAVCILMPFLPTDTVADGLRSTVYWTTLPSAIGLVAFALLRDLPAALREHRAAVQDRQACMAEAQRLDAALLYNMRLRTYLDEHKGLTVLDDGRLGRWQRATDTYDPVDLPPELEELRRRSRKPAAR